MVGMISALATILVAGIREEPYNWGAAVSLSITLLLGMLTGMVSKAMGLLYRSLILPSSEMDATGSITIQCLGPY
jgi:ABC-type xylose transport system permease subunit